MTQDQKMLGLFIASLIAVVALLLWSSPVKSAECPPAMASCKVLVISAEQADMIDQLISSTCIQGPYSQIDQVVKFYKEMLAKAPAGVVPPAQPKK